MEIGTEYVERQKINKERKYIACLTDPSGVTNTCFKKSYLTLRWNMKVEGEKIWTVRLHGGKVGV